VNPGLDTPLRGYSTSMEPRSDRQRSPARRRFMLIE